MTPLPFVADFAGGGLDSSVWVPHCLPECSSRGATCRATTLSRTDLLGLGSTLRNNMLQRFTGLPARFA